MIAANPMKISDEYREIAMQGEPIFDNKQKLVVISLQNYEEMRKAKHNLEYLKELDRRFERLANGEGIALTG